MAQKRLSMRKISQILRLHHELGLTSRQIGCSCGVARPTVEKYLSRASAAGLGWPLPEGMDEQQLYERLFPEATTGRGGSRPLPDMGYIHRELRRRHVTRQLLWEEYRQAYPEGYGYTQFCEHYNRWKASLDVTLRQQHVAGEKTFLDWAGTPAWWMDRACGHWCPGYLFVGVLGASDYLFATVLADQQLLSWIEAHIRMAEFMGGVTALWVPDNAKTGVTKPCYYEPEIHPTYQELADHYGVAILPTRTYAPRDKAKAENAVLHAERRILGTLRNRQFFSLGELDAAVQEGAKAINARPFQKLPGTRQTLFAQLDQPVLRPLPAHRYEPGEWGHASVNIDYHVQVDYHAYSVPYRLTQERVEIRLSARTVEIYHSGRRVALHVRSRQRGGFTTDPAHRPKAHQKHLEWTPGRLVDWAATIGPECAAAVRTLLAQKPHPEQGYRACLGLLRLARSYGPERMEGACRRAVALDVCTYRSLAAILKARLDEEPLPETPAAGATAPAHHDNLRGPAYYRATAPVSDNGKENGSC